jgi:hypothetical protein
MSWRGCVKNEPVLVRIKDEINTLTTVKREECKWVSHILRRNCLLKHSVEGKLEGKIGVTGRRGRRIKQLRYDLRKTREYWKLQEAPRFSLCKEMVLEQALDVS